MICDKLLAAFMLSTCWTNFDPLQDHYGFHLWGPCPRVLWNSEKNNKVSLTNFRFYTGCFSHYLNMAYSLQYHFCSWISFFLDYSSWISSNDLLKFIFLANKWTSVCVLRELTVRCVCMCLHARVFLNFFPFQGIVFNYRSIDFGVIGAFNAKSW